MSRTDKDTPEWARVTWWEPCHWGCDGENIKYPRYVCDLPDTPVRRHPSNISRPWTKRPRRVVPHCWWWPVEERQHRYTPSREDRRLEIHGPNRAQLRDQARRTVAQHRGGVEISEIDPPITSRLWWMY